MNRASLSEVFGLILSRSPDGIVVKVGTLDDSLASIGTLSPAEVADVRAALELDPVQIAGSEGDS